MINTQRITANSFQTPRVNWGSWQAQGLLGWYPMAHPGGRLLFDCTGHQIHGLFDATNPPIWDWQDGYPVLKFGVGSNATEVKFSRKIVPSVGLASMWMWIKNNGNTASGSPAHCTGAGSNSHYPFSGSDTTGNSYINWLTAVRIDNMSDGGFNKGQWHSVCVTNQEVASTGYKFYQNGMELGALGGRSADVTADENWYIGHSAGNPQFWPGWIGEIRFYNRPLSPGEVKELAHPLARLDLRAPQMSRTWFTSSALGGGGGASVSGGLFSAQTGF